MKIVFQELGQFKKKLILLILSVVCMTVCMMGWPILLGRLIDVAIPQEDYAVVFRVCGIMLLLIGAGLFFGIESSRFSADISMGVARNLRSKVFTKVTHFTEAQCDKFSISSLINRTNNDVNQLQLFLNQCLAMALAAPIMCIIGLVMSLTQSPSLSVVMIIAIPVAVLIVFLVGRKAMPLAEQIQEHIDELNLVTRENLTGARVIRAFGTTEFEKKRFDKVNASYRKLNMKSQNLMNLLIPLLVALLGLTAAAIMYLAVMNHAYENIDYTTGEVMALVSYVMQIMAAVVMMTVVFILLPRASSSANRVKEVLESESSMVFKAQTAVEPTQKGTLEFRNVSFTYEGSEQPALVDLSFKALPGETTAIIGGTGMGKSTIVNLIPRLFDATEGQVLVDGVDVRDYKLSELREKIGFVPQKSVLFSGTIDSNIAFGREGATEADIEEAARTAQSIDFITQKADGFASHVAQGGSNFSGGQKQRLAIARAMVRKPEVYVFDDSFSALDFKTDKALRTALHEQTKNGEATVVIVAQRISTIMDADRIIVIDRGEIMGIGKHQELLRNCPVYREIAISQLGKEAVDNV